jgi:hypothetical protein
MATSTLPITRTRTGILYPHAHWYFLLAMATTWLGFSQTYFAVIRTQPLLHHVHGALMGGWIALLIVQPLLYQTGRMRLHRTLGRWGAFALVPAIVVVGFLMMRGTLISTQLPPNMVDHLTFLDFTSLILLPTFVGLAIYYGRNVDLHARYIACTVLLMMPPAIVRVMPVLPIFRRSFQSNVNMAMGLMCLILMVLLADDARKGRMRAPYMVALAATIVVAVTANFAKSWDWWHALTAVIAR